MTLSLTLTVPPCTTYSTLSFPKPRPPSRIPRGVRHRDSNCSWLSRSPHHDVSPKTPGRSQSPSITFSDSSLSLSQRRAKVTSSLNICFLKSSIWVEDGKELDQMGESNCLKKKLSCWLLVLLLFFCQALGPEFIRMSDEPQILLELPGSIVVNFSSLVSK